MARKRRAPARAEWLEGEVQRARSFVQELQDAGGRPTARDRERAKLFLCLMAEEPRLAGRIRLAREELAWGPGAESFLRWVAAEFTERADLIAAQGVGGKHEMESEFAWAAHQLYWAMRMHQVKATEVSRIFARYGKAHSGAREEKQEKQRALLMRMEKEGASPEDFAEKLAKSPQLRKEYGLGRGRKDIARQLKRLRADLGRPLLVPDPQ